MWAGIQDAAKRTSEGIQDAAKRTTENISRGVDNFMSSLESEPYPGSAGYYSGGPYAGPGYPGGPYAGAPGYPGGPYPGANGPVATGVPVSDYGGAGGVPVASGVPVTGRPVHAAPASPGHGQAFAPFLLTNGTSVVVRGLTENAQHNGKEGLVVGYDLGSARYTVQLVQDASLLRIKHTNVLQRLSVEVSDLRERAHLNGRTGLVVGSDVGSGRYHVRLAQDETLALQMHNLVLPPGTRVTVVGLTGSAEYNGRIGSVVSYDRAAARYAVQLSESHELRVKRENVQL
jgi:hypothetical protein